jgi:hypothetical protein
MHAYIQISSYTYKSEKKIKIRETKTCSPLVRNTVFGCIILCSSGGSHGTCRGGKNMGKKN